MLRKKYTLLDKELVDKLVDRLVDSQRKIIYSMLANPNISIRELHLELKISTTAIDKHIRKIKKLGIVERVGSAKGGYWKVNAK
jgi:ATP-dependent DNA helicase RecG